MRGADSKVVPRCAVSGEEAEAWERAYFGQHPRAHLHPSLSVAFLIPVLEFVGPTDRPEVHALMFAPYRGTHSYLSRSTL